MDGRIGADGATTSQALYEVEAGRLTIFLGAGSGTGKTYQMLHEGHDLHEKGIRVVVAGVDPAEHPDISTQLQELPIMPLQNGDLDVQAILQAVPEVVLVEDLARINSTHAPTPTRLDDIQWLLSQGISVMTTLNIYDIDELREDVEKLTGIHPAHTVPLKILASAQEIKLVDVEPEVVIARLREEKEQAHGDPSNRATQLDEAHLSILRELAMRFVAGDVDEKLELYRRMHGMRSSSAIAERVLLAFQYNSNATLLIRRGQQVAKRLSADLRLVVVIRDRQKFTPEQLAFKSAAWQLAHKIHAQIEEIIGPEDESPAATLAKYASEHGVTRIIIGESRRTRWEEFRRGSVLQELVDRAKHVDLMIVTDRRSDHGERLLTYRQRYRNMQYMVPRSASHPHDGLLPNSRSRFKIYIGSAPGVGKTYTMLREARELKARGVDIVGALIETHNRSGTVAQIGDLEVIPRKTIEFRGTAFTEMDLDAVLARHPAVALVDELAHTNIEGCRHRKRYEDVVTLLEAGISVISTLNVQHLESLNDSIRALTGVKVRETVPDSVLRMADEVVLIDVPPETLQKRMREGKIYTLDKAEQALSNFFRTGNLIALRELALREVADHIDERLESHDERSALRGPWRRIEVVYVCINLKPKAERLIRRGFRTADRLKAKLYVGIVMVATDGAPDQQAQDRLRALRELTERLGGEFIVLHAAGFRDIPRMLASDIERRLTTQVVVGHSTRKPLELLRRGHTLQTLLRSIKNVDVVVIAEEATTGGGA
jgi:two-component system sensor histidine kinase KdpD